MSESDNHKPIRRVEPRNTGRGDQPQAHSEEDDAILDRIWDAENRRASKPGEEKRR